MVRSPQVVRDIDWLNQCWPDDRKQEGQFPKVLALPEQKCVTRGARPPVRSYTRCQYKIVQQWVPRFKSAQDKTIRDLGAVESACHAYTKNYVFPTTDKSNA